MSFENLMRSLASNSSDKYTALDFDPEDRQYDAVGQPEAGRERLGCADDEK